MTDRAELRAILADWTGNRCQWPNCDEGGSPLQLAHVFGVGMGGRPSADTIDNVALLCKYHHDLLDGRTHINLRYELAQLLNSYLATGWRRSIQTGADVVERNP
jgi:hypothetical protein